MQMIQPSRRPDAVPVAVMGQDIADRMGTPIAVVGVIGGLTAVVIESQLREGDRVLARFKPRVAVRP